MAIGVSISMPDVTQVQYEQLNESIFGHYPMTEADAPDGLIMHSAGPMPGGWHVYDVWESREGFERFGERLAPAVRDVLGRSMSDQKLQYFDVHNFLQTDRVFPRVAA
jgi:hypothetical protein